MKIDVWTHFLSPAYVRHLEAEAAGGHKVASFLLVNRALHNLDRRFEVMDRFDARKILRIDAAQ